MEINWLGHSCFRIKGSRSTIITDPYPPGMGYTASKLTANIVTVSHQHPEHSYVQTVEGEPRVIKGPGEYEIGGVMIVGVATFHDDEKGAKRGKNTVYAIELDDVVICHLGDLGHALTTGQIEQIDNVDVLMVPAGDLSTISVKVAAEVVRQLDPKVVIPMHYKTPALPNSELEPVDKFLKEMGAAAATPQAKLSITRSSMPATMQVFLLSY